MQVNPDIIRRLKEAVAMTGLTPEEFTDKFIRPPLTIFDFFEGRKTELTFSIEFALQQVYKINLEWLKTGKGAKKLSHVALNELATDKEILLGNFEKMSLAYQKKFIKASYRYVRQSRIDSARKAE